MNFKDAIEHLKSGSKVTRAEFKNKIYFKIIDNKIKTYQFLLQNYHYNEDIMLSTEWIINDKKYDFPDLIPMLLDGNKAKLPSWEDSYIYYDSQSKDIIYHSYQEFSFAPGLSWFLAKDWMILT